MNTFASALKWNWFSSCSTFLALLFLLMGATCSYRSPGDVGAGWYTGFLGALILLYINGLGLKVLWRERWIRRLGLYLSTGIVLGVLLLLIHAWQEQRQFDYWSHHGIRYFDPIGSSTVTSASK